MKTSSKSYHSFPWNHEGIDYIVEFVYYAPFAGGRDHGVQVEPDGGDEVEICTIAIKDTRLLSWREIQALMPRVEFACWDYLHSLTFSQE
jgi:hypothetical protein